MKIMGLKNNSVVELKGGDIVVLRNGDVLSYDEYYDKITNSEDSRVNYTEDLTHKNRPELDIIEVKRPTAYETIFSTECVACKDTADEVVKENVVVKETATGKSITIKIDL